MTEAPHYCRSSAYELFTAQLKTLEETDSLLRAAVAVSMHEFGDTSLAGVETELDGIAAEYDWFLANHATARGVGAH